MDRDEVGKTILSQKELNTLRAAPINSKEQFDIICDLTMTTALFGGRDYSDSSDQSACSPVAYSPVQNQQAA